MVWVGMGCNVKWAGSVWGSSYNRLVGFGISFRFLGSKRLQTMVQLISLIQWKHMASMLPPPAQSHDTATRASLSPTSGTGAPIHPTLLLPTSLDQDAAPARTARPPGCQGGHHRRLLPYWTVPRVCPRCCLRRRALDLVERRAAVLLGMASCSKLKTRSPGQHKSPQDLRGVVQVHGGHLHQASLVHAIVEIADAS